MPKTWTNPNSPDFVWTETPREKKGWWDLKVFCVALIFVPIAIFLSWVVFGELELVSKLLKEILK